MSQTIENLAKAKAALVIDQPFFASLLLGMPMTLDPSVKTMATDGESIRVNPEFSDKLTHSERVFVLAHETMHNVFQHMFRRGARDPKRWNIAGDYIINNELVREKVGAMPANGLHDPKLVEAGDGTTEGVYGLLPESPKDGDKEKSDGSGDGAGYPDIGEAGGPLDDCQDATGDKAELAAKEADMRVKIVQAANAAKMQGKLSAGLERMVKEMTKTRIDWRMVLRRFLSERAKVELSYGRPKRRFLADDIYLPGLTGEKLGTLVFAVDCSGSINETTLAMFTAEMNAIKQDVCPAMVHVLYFDTKVLRQDSFDADTDLIVKPCGGGGTAFSPVFEHIDRENLNPVACVFLTDLCCSDFGPAPSYPVLWASTDDGNPPFGETVLITEEN